MHALKVGLPIMALLAMPAIIPARRPPNYRPGELPAEQAGRA
jgi:hypothetical protein